MENIKQKKKKKSSKEKIEENRKKIVDRLISNMEKGYIFSEWAWNRKAFLPRNAITGTPYQGINRINLSFEAIERNYNDPRWLTLRKANEMGYTIKSGAKGVFCEKWIWQKLEKVINKETGEIEKDEDGNEKASYVYNAWGNILSQSEDELSSINPLRYRGYVYDEDTTLYYLQTRYYDPTTGRFINADDTVFISSSGTAIGDSIYTYCENEPVNRSDAEGTCYFDIKDNIKHFNSEYRLDFIKIGEKKRENTIESLQLENGFICVIINTLGL